MVFFFISFVCIDELADIRYQEALRLILVTLSELAGNSVSITSSSDMKARQRKADRFSGVWPYRGKAAYRVLSGAVLGAPDFSRVEGSQSENRHCNERGVRSVQSTPPSFRLDLTNGYKKADRNSAAGRDKTVFATDQSREMRTSFLPSRSSSRTSTCSSLDVLMVRPT